MEYRMKGGAVYTDEDFDKLGDACERGEYPGTPGEWIVRPQGRPTMYGEELVTIAFKVPVSQRDAVDRKAKALGESRSQFMRVALERALA